MRRLLPIVLAAAAALLPAPLPADDPPENPLPVSRSTILRKEKTTWTVEGRQRIPRGVEISVQKDVLIKARGKGPAVLEVEGSFPAHGTTDREIILEGVTVEPAETHGEIHLEHCIFRKGGGVVNPTGKPSDGDILVQSCTFGDGARFDLAVTGGTIQLLDSGGSGPIRILGVDPQDSRNRAKVTLRGTKFYGLELVNLADVTVRINQIRSDPAILRDNDVLVFDGNKVEAKELRLEQSKAGCFGKTQFMKCDLYCAKVVFKAPVEKGKSDAVEVDKCWFQGRTDRKEIEAVIRDAAVDETTGVKVTVRNPLERPLELAGPVNR